LVTRVASRRDARVTRVQITTEGLALVGRAAARVTSELEVLVAGVPDADQGQLVRVVSSVLGGQPGRRSLDAPD
jgi:DNA-binding MarR family transcriptional regulator